MASRILYVNPFPDCRVETMTLAGVRRYAGVRGWAVEAVRSEALAAGRLPALLRTIRPVGCIVECSGGRAPLAQVRFGRIPVVFCNGAKIRGGSRVACVTVDDAAVAKAAFRELSAGRPSAFAVVSAQQRRVWSTLRMEAFQSEVRAAGCGCLSFGECDSPDEPPDSRARRLADWVRSLPRGCAIFAVHDEATAEVVAAARAAFRSIPRELTLLGVDNDTSICEVSRPTISSIQLDFERMGNLSAKMLAGRMEHRPRGDDRVIAIGPLLVVRRESTRGSGRREPRILEAVEIIRREACDGLTAESLAQRFAGSRRHFERRFREATGHSVLDEILHVRLDKAFTLLSETNTAIGVIYALCGFRSPRALD
ncbi:MAG: substrate-binding domain-containing protein, partial [Kiritimatiellae bacterium]|nr:substrate-binding domain-containing protein [Kiritimatiellia bacterium]